MTAYRTENWDGSVKHAEASADMVRYSYDDKHSGKHTDGRHDNLYPHGNRHAKHDKDAAFAYQIVETDRTFTYDDAGKLLSCTETEDNYGTYTYTYEYDLMGNRTAVTKTAEDGTVAEWEKYEYNESSQLVAEELYNGKKTTKLAYAYDADGNLISETGKTGTEKVEKSYEYDVENRLAAVYDADELLMAAAYDGDGNRVFQLNCNLHTDEDWKGNSGNGNGNNKDNKGSGNNGKGNTGSTGKGSNNGKGNTGNNGNGKSNGKGNSKSSGTDDAGYGNATNAEENNSQNQSGILFPIDGEVSETEQSLINKIKTTGREKNYELIEYLNDVNREYTEVLVEQNINGRLDTAYVYGSANSTGGRLSLDRFDGSRGYYLYDPKGNVTGITNEEGQVYQSYRYGSFGEITFGAPQYENEYTYNGESYNPNIESQYLRARYYNVVHADFLTEDSYLGNIYEPLTLNRYNYCVSNPVNHRDPSGNMHVIDELGQERYFSPRSDEVSLPEAETSEYYEMAEAAMAPMNSFIMGFGVSEMKALLEIPTIVYYPGIMSEDLVGIQNGPNQQMFNNYDAGVENMLLCLTGEAKDRTAFYAGRCFADATNTVLGAVVMAEGIGNITAGIGSMVPEVASGAGVVALPASVAVVAEGALITTVGVEITTQGMVSFMQDFSRYQESKASKDTTSGENGAGAKGDSDPKRNRIPENDSITGHIFRDEEGHIPDTPENRTLLEDVANDSANFRGTDKYGNEWYTKTRSDGSQVWVESRNGNIFEGGINDTPKPWNPETGLKKP